MPGAVGTPASARASSGGWRPWMTPLPRGRGVAVAWSSLPDGYGHGLGGLGRIFTRETETANRKHSGGRERHGERRDSRSQGRRGIFFASEIADICDRTSSAGIAGREPANSMAVASVSLVPALPGRRRGCGRNLGALGRHSSERGDELLPLVNTCPSDPRPTPATSARGAGTTRGRAPRPSRGPLEIARRIEERPRIVISSSASILVDRHRGGPSCPASTKKRLGGSNGGVQNANDELRLDCRRRTAVVERAAPRARPKHHRRRSDDSRRFHGAARPMYANLALDAPVARRLCPRPSPRQNPGCVRFRPARPRCSGAIRHDADAEAARRSPTSRRAPRGVLEVRRRECSR